MKIGSKMLLGLPECSAATVVNLFEKIVRTARTKTVSDFIHPSPNCNSLL